MQSNQEKSAPMNDLDRVEKKVCDTLSKYHNCAQCTLLAIQEVSGLKDEVMAKAASSLAGGIGGTGSACGALTGAALALGMKYGRDVSLLGGPEEPAVEAAMAAEAPVVKLVKWFEREFGYINCRDIRKKYIGTDLSWDIPWQLELIDKLGADESCTKLAAKTARRAIAMLENPDISLLEEV